MMLVVISIIVLVVGLMGCSSLKFSQKKVRVTVEESAKIIIISGLEPGEVPVWTSSNHPVATVDDNGNVTARTIGVSTIKAIADKKTGKCKVTVLPKRVILSETNVEMRVGSTKMLTVLSGVTSEETPIWASSNSDVAIVDDDGNVTAVAAGIATISASVSGKSSGNCLVTVVATSLTLSVSDFNLIVDESKTINITAGLAEGESATWESDSPCATVSANGKVTGISEGSALITAFAGTKKGQCEVTVKALSLSKTTHTFNENETLLLQVNNAPAGAKITWTVFDPAYAKVSPTTGTQTTVTALKAGTTKVVAKIGEIEKTCTITIKQDLTPLELSRTTLTLDKNETMELQVNNAPGATITWKVKDPSVAKISSTSGQKIVVTGLNLGKTDITAQTGSRQGKCDITIDDKESKRREEINAHLRATTNTPLTKNYTADRPAGNEYKIVGTTCYETVTETKDYKSSRSTDIAASSISVFPGQLVYLDEALTAGNPRQVNLDHGAVTLTVKFGGHTETRTIANASQSLIETAIDNMVKKFWESGYLASPITASSYSESDNLSKMAFDMKVDISFLKNKVKVNVNTSSTNHKVVKITEFTQSFFTVEISQNSNRADYFGKNVTLANVKSEGVTATNLGVVKKITYGRKVYVIDEYELKDFSLNADQSAKVYGQSFSSSQDITKTSKSSKRWAYVVGGSGTFAAGVIEDSAKIVKLIKNEPEFTKTSPLLPISYEVGYINGLQTASVTHEGKYSETYFRMFPKHVDVKVYSNYYGNGMGSQHAKVEFRYTAGKLSPDRKSIIERKVECVQDNKLAIMCGPNDNLKTFSMGNGNLGLKADEFIFGDVEINIRSRSNTVNWADRVKQRFNFTPGNIEIRITGDTPKVITEIKQKIDGMETILKERK